MRSHPFESSLPLSTSDSPAQEPINAPSSASVGIWGEVAALARLASLSKTEEEVVQRVAALLLSWFQVRYAEIRLIGSDPSIAAIASPDGSVALGESRSLSAEQNDLLSAGQKPSPLTLLVPLQSGEGVLGSLLLADPLSGATFSAEQHQLAGLIAEYVALLLLERRARERVHSLAVAEERSRLARELHDTVAQSLAALVVQLDAVEEPRGEVLAARALAHRALEDARRAIWGLRPALLETLPFYEALAREVERVADEGHLSSRVTVVGQPRALVPQQEMALLRIAQEALANTVRHAAARRVRAGLEYTRDGVRLSLEDDGRGFDPAQQEARQQQAAQATWPPYFVDPAAPTSVGLPGHFGLQHMRERARLVGGWLELESAPGQGTHLVVEVSYLPVGERKPASSIQVAGVTAAEGQSASVQPLPDPAAPDEPANSAPRLSTPLVGRIRILIADDHALTRAGIRRVLEAEPDFEVVGEAADGLQALAEAQDLGPQVVLMDRRMPGMDGLEALRQLRASNRAVRVLMLSAYEQDEDVFESLKAGASGYVLKDMAPHELARAVREVARGETLLAPGLTGKLVDRFGQLARGEGQARLTAREYEVLCHLASGLRNKEIARQLQVGERTITFHLEHIYQKLQVSNRTEALSRALELGLLRP